MFTGLVQAQGTVRARERSSSGARILVDGALEGVKLGDSICVNGCCLTAVQVSSSGFLVDVSAETLTRTTLGRLTVGHRVNLEPSLTLADPLGGHLVTGHVDAVASVLSVRMSGETAQVRFQLPKGLEAMVAEKGSVCLDGVSLTVNGATNADFLVTLIPHTRAATTLGRLQTGSEVNLEVDLIARYVARRFEWLETGGGNAKLTPDDDLMTTLKKAGLV